MSNVNSNDEIKWLEKSIANKNITYYEYSNFERLQLIRDGSFGSIVRAYWKNTDNVFVLKFFNNQISTLKEIIKELKFHWYVNSHANILKFYGITKVETDVHKIYSLVMEYADGGTLKTYLNEHFNELEWKDKYSLALQLASAVLRLHECDIIHRDLNVENILIHQKSIKLADFGLSKKIAEASNITLEMFGLPYIDPKLFFNQYNINNQGEIYRLNKSSDVYSIGVIMWQLSSGYQPFSNEHVNDISLAVAIQRGKREKIIVGTPIEYSDLYTKCWKGESNERPKIIEVVSTLEVICNSELASGKIHNAIDQLIEVLNKKHNRGIMFDQGRPFINQQISHLNLNTNELITWLSRNQVKAQYIWLLGLFFYYKIDTEQNSNSAFQLFFRASQFNYSLAQVYLAKCYNDGYEIEQNKCSAFEWYQKSVKNESIIGQFYLGCCYEYGIGVEKDEKKSIYWYNKAAENGNGLALYSLGVCHEFGRGVEKNDAKAFEFYKNSAEQGDLAAQYKFAFCCENGIGTEVNKGKAFELYKYAAERGSAFAQNSLGLLYEQGEGIKKNLVMAFYWYKKSAGNGYKIAQYNLGICYEYGKGIEKNEVGAVEFYKKSAEQGYLNAQYKIACCYDNGIGTNVNKKKAFDLFKNASEKDHKLAQNSLGLLYEKAFEYYKKLASQDYLDAQYKVGYCYEYGIGIKKDEIKAFEIYNKLANQSYLDAQYRVAYCYDKGIGIKVNKKKAFELFKDAADKGNKFAQNSDLTAQYKFACCYEKGIGTEVNKEKAFEFYMYAAERGNVFAQNSLGLLYEQGEGTEKNLESACFWYNKAARNSYDVAHHNLLSLKCMDNSNYITMVNIMEKEALFNKHDPQHPTKVHGIKIDKVKRIHNELNHPIVEEVTITRDQALMDWIIADLQPYSVVTSIQFINLLGTLDPR
ncbi:5991_t:CDS:10 [Funneliformis geosporum]|nr:5991_t:CDS:10 [Funneliformis geosporum]